MGQQKYDRAIRPDAQAFDEIRIETVPRFKQSGLSGDEWRITAKIQFYRKGELIHSVAARNVETACNLLPSMLLKAIDEGHANFAGDGVTCDQEGCPRPVFVTYRIKRFYSTDRPHQWNSEPEVETVRRFCIEHTHRGNADFNDRNSNYELVDGPGNPVQYQRTVPKEVLPTEEMLEKIKGWEKPELSEQERRAAFAKYANYTAWVKARDAELAKPEPVQPGMSAKAEAAAIAGAIADRDAIRKNQSIAGVVTDYPLILNVPNRFFTCGSCNKVSENVTAYMLINCGTIRIHLCSKCLRMLGKQIAEVQEKQPGPVDR